MTTAAPLLSAEQLDVLEKAATSMLNDNEIMLSMDITEEQLQRHYNVVEKARVKLKQRLNAKQIAQAAEKGDTGAIIDSIPRNNIQFSMYKPSRGGARAGSGPKVGSTNKITGKSILEAVFKRTGDTFENMLVDGYVEAIEKNDRNARFQYERLILSKVVSDKADDTVKRTAEEVNERLKVLMDKANGSH
jgi:hypothetical protein